MKRTQVIDTAPTSGLSRWIGAAALIGLLIAGTGAFAMWAMAEEPAPAVEYKYELVAEYPHDPQAFTQGLVVDGAHILESTGRYGASTLRRVDLKTGRVVQGQPLHRDIFAEGITIWDDEIFMLTWRNRVVLVFDKTTFRLKRQMRWNGEGWGLTHDDKHLIMSDGSEYLRFLDPKTLAQARRVRVTDQGRPVQKLNELEFIDKEIWANIWYEDRIARIDPESGRVTGWIDLSKLWPANARPDKEHVLNGIAHEPSTGRLFVTGKYWPKLYEIKVSPKDAGLPPP